MPVYLKIQGVINIFLTLSIHTFARGDIIPFIPLFEIQKR